MATMGGFDMGFDNIPSSAVAAFGSTAMDGDEYVRCTRCSYGGCDVRVSLCGCTLHARCLTLNHQGPLELCPSCEKPTQGLVLFPMSFREIDDSHRFATALPRAAAAKSRGRKRKAEGGDSALDEKGSYISERRTGRWTNEEMAYCDKLMDKFENGQIPVADGVKLNEFLGNMLKSKQSRLTKKMKNAKLSSKTFQRTSGVLGTNEGREFSELEESFFHAVTDHQERAEIKFHMQKEWREQFSQICAHIGQPLDADSWLSSVEEMDRRASQAKDSARMTKRKLMMGVALRTDSRNPDHGVFIEKTDAEVRAAGLIGDDLHSDRDMEEELLSLLVDDKKLAHTMDVNGKSSLLHSAPFLAKVTAYLQRHGVPFEHIDVWVPSFVPGSEGDQTSCRLCYAGSATTDTIVGEDGKTSRSLASEEKFNLYAFGDYSQKFSFDVGCGLPGRVYESGRPTWEQSVHNAPHNHFERCGGAFQWGIKTVVGIPIASPNVGRIVVTLYSCLDRPKDEDIVAKLSEEFTRLTPAPKWKLVVDIGDEDVTAVSCSAGITTSLATAPIEQSIEVDDMPIASPVTSAFAAGARDARIDEVVSLLGEFMPSDPASPVAPYVSGFMSLRLLLLRPSRTVEEDELTRTILDSFSSYTAGGRARADIAVMLARDYMFLGQQQQQQQPQYGYQSQGMMSSAAPVPSDSSGLSLFGLPSTSSSLQNSPALTPIPIPGSIDALSIVSN